jgi:threonine dehydratase
VVRTPLRHSPWLSDVSGCDVFLKLETVQPTFSFKIRGALNAVLALVEQSGKNAPPLVTASAGNHGRALAHAAQLAGIPLTVYVPADAPRTKIDAIRRAGAHLETCDNYDEAESRAKEHGRTGTALFISPYSHPDVIAAAGTVALEILEDRPGIDAIVVPVGGGGLLSGVAIAATALSPAATVIGVEAEASTAFTHSLAAGHIVQIDVHPSLADGLTGNLDPDTITFDIVQRLVKAIAVVREDQLKQAVAGLFHEERLIAEGAGAAGAAAILAGALDSGSREVAVILSGANIDSEKLKKLI